MKKFIIVFLFLLCFLYISILVKADNDKKVIYIDPGHGGLDGGTSIDQYKESDLALQISNHLKNEFESNGYLVKMTRYEDVSLCRDEYIKKEDLETRVNLVNNSNCLLGISIHLNQFSIEKYSGAQVFYNDTNIYNEYISYNIQNSLKEILSNTNRSIVKRDNVFLLNKITKPFCIVECGFMSNKTELSLLIDEEYQKKIAKAIYVGSLSYLSNYE